MSQGFSTLFDQNYFKRSPMIRLKKSGLSYTKWQQWLYLESNTSPNR